MLTVNGSGMQKFTVFRVPGFFLGRTQMKPDEP
jgi:hypothetical protein